VRSGRRSTLDGVEVFGGYTRLKSGSTTLSGVELSVDVPWRRRTRLVADVARQSSSFAGADLSQAVLGLGIQREGRYRRLRPFGRGLLGLAKGTTTIATASDSTVGLMVGIGGGASYPLRQRLAARVQADLLLVRGDGRWEGDPRFGLGLAYRFGR